MNKEKSLVVAVVAGLCFSLYAELKNGMFFALGEVPAEITVQRRAGDPVRFSLAANPTTGYQWDAEWNPSECDVSLEFRAPKVANPPHCGSGGETEVVVTSKIYTPARVELRYRRPWEKETPPIKTVRLIVYTIGETKGAMFSFGTNNFDPGPKDLSRWLEAIRWLDLGPSDRWFAKRP